MRRVPHDAFVSNAPATWKDKVPQVVDNTQGKRWYLDRLDERVRRKVTCGNAGKLDEQIK